jgi:chromosomal replication initiator protein
MPESSSKNNPFFLLQQQNPGLAAQYGSVWDNVFSYLKDTCAEVAVNTWLTNIYLVNVEGNQITLFISNEFQKEIVISHYERHIKAGFKFFLNRDVEIRYADQKQENESPPVFQETVGLGSDFLNGGMDYEYTFDTFIVGNSNRFAHAACLNVANMPAQSYNPLFVYGGSGLGKTHLLYAIMNHIKENFPDFKVLYLRGDDFANELISSIQKGTNTEFRSKYRGVDILLVDDIQFIAGKDMTQQEFFHTFNTLYEEKKQIVLTSDRPPKEMATLEDRLRTRFEWGLIADIQPPDFETRAAIIRRKANMIGIELSDDVIELISNGVKTNIRQLEGAVKKLKAYKQLTGSNINLSVAQEAIKDILTNKNVKAITPDAIIEEISSFFHISVSDIIGKKRTNEISNPRQIAMFITREMTDLSLPGIGQIFGGRDHTTVLHAINKVEKDMEKDPRLKQIISDLTKNLKNF